MWLNVLKRSCNLKLICKRSAENAEVSNNHTKCRINLEFRNNHFNKTQLGVQERRRSNKLEGNFRTITWPLPQSVNLDIGNRKETVTYFTKGYIITE